VEWLKLGTLARAVCVVHSMQPSPNDFDLVFKFQDSTKSKRPCLLSRSLGPTALSEGKEGKGRASELKERNFWLNPNNCVEAPPAGH